MTEGRGDLFACAWKACEEGGEKEKVVIVFVVVVVVC